MRNFHRLAAGVDVTPLLNAILRQPELWNQYEVRTNYHPNSAHRDANDILLRYNKFDEGDDFVEKVCTEVMVANYPAFGALPQARPIIFDLMRRVEGEHLGRVFIARLAPGVTILPHSDDIALAREAFPDKIVPAQYYDRYHVVLHSLPGAMFTCGEEKTYMAPGECWWFNNRIEHTVTNNSAEDRLHMILDIATYHQDYVPTGALPGRPLEPSLTIKS